MATYAIHESSKMIVLNTKKKTSSIGYVPEIQDELTYMKFNKREGRLNKKYYSTQRIYNKIINGCCEQFYKGILE